MTQGQVATDTVAYSYETVEVPLGSKNGHATPRSACTCTGRRVVFAYVESWLSRL